MPFTYYAQVIVKKIIFVLGVLVFLLLFGFIGAFFYTYGSVNSFLYEIDTIVANFWNPNMQRQVMAEEDCLAQGGTWETIGGFTEDFACRFMAKDGGESCSSGFSCESGACTLGNGERELQREKAWPKTGSCAKYYPMGLSCGQYVSFGFMSEAYCGK